MRTAIVMSRLPRLIDPRAAWLGGLRAALRRVLHQGDSLVVVDGTAGSAFVRRGAERLGIPVETVSVSPSTETDPELATPDQALMQSASAIIALGIRTNGNVHRILRERLAQGTPVELCDVLDLQPESVRSDLTSLGASIWTPDTSLTIPLGSSPLNDAPSLPDVYEIAPLPSANDWVYLTHTTRACTGSWPGESSEQHIDSLLDESESADHSPAAALRRIVSTQTLLASSRVIRGGFPMVCLTEVPLAELPLLRQYRTHRTRWDFEPFGLCIDRTWLVDRGARPVIYGDEVTWQSLPAADRPFFQFRADGVESAASIDWSVEREWRVEGDIDLRELAADRAMVFVPRSAAAMAIASVSRWPITLWPDPAE